MTALRAFIRHHCRLAALLLVLALCVKAVIPAGYMLETSPQRTVSIAVCADSSGAGHAIEVAIPAKPTGKADGVHKQVACGFASLADSALGGADAFLLALAFAFILVLGLAPARRLPFARAFHLRPPLRGPPATA